MYSEKLQRMTNGVGGLHDGQDGKCWRLTSAREPDVKVRHCWAPVQRRPPTLSVQFSNTQADVRRQHRPECRPMSANVSRRHCWSNFLTLRPTSACLLAGWSVVGLSGGKLDRQCRRPTLADTQSITLV